MIDDDEAFVPPTVVGQMDPAQVQARLEAEGRFQKRPPRRFLRRLPRKTETMSNEEKVREFHTTMGFPAPDKPTYPDNKLWKFRRRLIMEEFKELDDAYSEGDFVEMADALADMLYVVYGAAAAFGIQMQPIFDEVHRTNMEKRKGPKDPEGKQMKPPGWLPPNILAALIAQGWDPNDPEFLKTVNHQRKARGLDPIPDKG